MAVERFEVLEVCAARVRDDRRRRQRDVRERCDLARVTHRHLDDGHLVDGPQREQRERNSPVVVQVPLRAECRRGRRERLGDQLLGGGLAGAAGHADEQARPVLAQTVRDALERVGDVVDEHQRPQGQVLDARPHIAQAQRRAGAPCERLVEVGVPVDVPARQGDEQHAGLERARVETRARDPGSQQRLARHRVPRHLLHDEIAVRPLCERRQCDHRFGGGRHVHTPPPAARRSRATRRSSNGVTTPAIVCVVSWPLPAINTTSPGRAA